MTDLAMCPCGSGKHKHLLRDIMNVPTGYVCDDCEDDHRGKFAPHVFGGSRAQYMDVLHHSGERLDNDY